MATDVFSLLGTISVDVSAFISNINNATLAVNNLLSAINGVNGTTVNPTVQPTGGGTGGSGSGGWIFTTTSGTRTNTSSPSTSGTANGTKNTGGTKDTGVVGEGNKKISSFWGGVGSNLTSMAAYKVGMWAFDKGKQVANTGYEYNKNMELWKSQLMNYVGGDEQLAGQLLKDLEQHAIDTPYSLTEIISSGTQLLSSNKVKPEELIDTLESIGELANGSTENYGNIVKAYMQVLQKDKLMAEEANKQFANANVNAWEVVAQYFSKTDRGGQDEWTASDVIDLSADPKTMVTADEFKAAVHFATHDPEGLYYGRMDAVMDTTAGQVEKTKDKATKTSGALMFPFFKEFGDDTLPAVNEALERVNEIIEENQERIEPVADAVGTVAEAALNAGVAVLEAEAEHEGLLASSSLGAGAALASASHPLFGGILMAAGALGLGAKFKNGGEELIRKELEKPDGERKYYITEETAAALKSGIAPEDLEGELADDYASGVYIAGLNSILMNGTFGKPYRNGQMQRELMENFPKKFYGYNPDTDRNSLPLQKAWLTYGDHSYSVAEDQDAFIAEAAGSLSAWNRKTTGEMEKMWDAYRAAKSAGTTFEPDQYMERIYAEMDALFERYGVTYKVDEQKEAGMETFLHNMLQLSLDTEDLPVEWFTYPQDGVGGNNGAKNDIYDMKPEGLFGSTFQMLGAQFALNREEMISAMREGISGMTITATVNTGNVNLDTGELVGTLTPQIDWQLGVLGSRKDRG